MAEKKEKETSWDEIGKAIGQKIEKASKEGKFNCKSWDLEHEEGGKKGRHRFKCAVKENKTGGCFYFLGFIGALVYYITTAPSFWDAVVGFFKAIVWPAFLVYGVLQFIGI